MDAILNVVDHVIGVYGGASALARRLGVTRNAINCWKLKKRVPASRVIELERLTGVSRHLIRPDLYPEAPSNSE